MFRFGKYCVFGGTRVIQINKLGLTSKFYSSLSTSEMEKIKISDHLILRQTIDQTKNQSGGKARPLVLFFPWMNAKAAAVQKYCDIYHERGMDVLIVSSSAKHFLWPESAGPLAAEVLDYTKKHHIHRPLLIHGLSIGAYFFTVCLMQMIMNPQKYKQLEQQICGQIYDSLTVGSVQRMALGIAKSITNNQTLSSSIKGSILTYFALTHSHTVAQYDKLIALFKEKPHRSPALLFYSLDDPMCDPDSMADIIDTWNKLGMSVTHKCWERSKHAGHLKQHTADYIQTLDTFLRQLTFDINPKSKL
ncbi:uncharacterized protein LOC106150985 [Lingula anatina]|uniref:Uncharacterized protein LOC106150985 n=1 Tax=Lingula anatina TaxID=7574 RepID=A0A1S3H2Y1_LINAN|nr:uncharacterized protein LOC106150985 [Lingula anatina]|eukprot:XP_013379494.1 uncharacterized protein LOC106150985 [Lingula anatina]